MHPILRAMTLCTLTLASPAPSHAAPEPELEAVALTLLPMPQSVVLEAELVQLALPLVADLQPPPGSTEAERARLARAVRRLEARLLGVPVGPAAAVRPRAARLTIVWALPAEVPQALGESEAYTLSIAPGQVRLSAETPLGVLRGLETLGQLARRSGPDVVVPTGHIEDAPRFAWRGLMIDAARHFIPVPVLEQQLDAMAAVKLNVLHWHLTDDQGFHWASARHPALQTHGSGGQSYRAADIRAVVAYAADRGIRVVPEMDMPGHTASWFVGHPELASAPGPHTLSARWGVFDDALDPTREHTYAFVDDLLGELAALFPDAYLHIGGDEVTGKHWQHSAHIQAFMAEHHMADTAALQTYFVGRVARMARAHGKHVVGWDEILQDGLEPDTVIQSWRGPDGLRAALKAGYRGLLSHGYYLQTDAAAHYGVDPADGIDGSLSSGLLGGEACQWTELVSPALLHASIWPRAAAVAERLWSQPEQRDVDDLYRRLGAQALRLSALGLDAEGAQAEAIQALLPGADVAPLTRLAQVLEGRRQNWWPNFKVRRTLTAFSDQLWPEVPLRRTFDADVSVLLDPEATSDQRARAETAVGNVLAGILANRTPVLALASGRPELDDVRQLADASATTAAWGMVALHALRMPPREVDWERGVAAVQPQHERRDLGVAIAIAPGVQRLLEAAQRGP